MNNSYDTRKSSNGGTVFLLVCLPFLAVAALLFFVSTVKVPPHVEEIKPPVQLTLEGIQVEQEAATAPEGFSVDNQLVVTEGFDLLGPQSPVVTRFDDLPVSPGETFAQIAVRVRDEIAYQDPEMLTWDPARFERREDMSLFFNEDGSPREGFTRRWHGDYAAWVLVMHPEWLSPSAVNNEAAVIYWTLYLQFRANVPEEKPTGSAPWEWNGIRPAWLD